jgi:hypothetical protein
MVNKHFSQIIRATFLAFSFCIYCTGSYSQVTAALNTKSGYPAVIFVDNRRANFPMAYLDPNNIASMQIIKGADSINKTGGSVYITTKSGYLPALTLADILRGQPEFNAKNILYIMDGNLISDTTNLRIDPFTLVKVQTVNSADASYLAQKGEPLVVVMISTTTKYKQAGKDQILLQ